MLRPTTFLLLATTATTLQAQLTPEQRAAREAPPGAPIWVNEVTDRSTPLHPREYAINEVRAREAGRSPQLRDRATTAILPAVIGEHWIALTPASEAPQAVQRPGSRTYSLTAGQQTILTLSPRRATPGTEAVMVLRIDRAGGTGVWSAAPVSVVDTERHHTVMLPGLERGDYVLTIEVYVSGDPEIPESRSVNPLRVD